MHLRTLFVNINFKYELKLNCKVVFIDGYLSKPAFYQDFVEFGNVNDRRRGKGNKNYLTFMKRSKLFGKIIFCKILPPGLIRKYNNLKFICGIAIMK